MENFNIEPYNTNTQSTFAKEEAYLRAKKRLDKVVGFYWHFAIYVVVNVFLILLIGLNSEGDFWHFGTISTPLFWGIGLGFHFLGVFGPNFLFNKNWEKRKIQEYMEKDSQEFKRFE